MTFAKPMNLEFLSPRAVIDLARRYFETPKGDDIPLPVAQPVAMPDSLDREHYARLLEHKQDRQLLTEVEREDTDMLDRVRAALYED